MGGQSLPRDGTAITLEGGPLEMDTTARTYRTSAGNRWSDVIRILDPKGFSPAANTTVGPPSIPTAEPVALRHETIRGPERYPH